MITPNINGFLFYFVQSVTDLIDYHHSMIHYYINRPSPASRKPAVTVTPPARSTPSASRSAPSSRKRELRDVSPDPPPLRQMRRSSPARQAKAEIVTPVTTNKPTASTSRRSRVPSYNVSVGLSYTHISFRTEIYVDFNLETWLRIVKFME